MAPHQQYYHTAPNQPPMTLDEELSKYMSLRKVQHRPQQGSLDHNGMLSPPLDSWAGPSPGQPGFLPALVDPMQGAYNMQFDFNGFVGGASMAPMYGPLYTKPIPPNVLSVTIEKTDPFRMDHLLTNPVVRLHILDPSSGSYTRNLAETGMNVDPVAQAEEYLPSIQTAPFDLLSRPGVSNAAVWRERLVVDEAIERLVALDTLLIFEVLQPAVSYRRHAKHKKEFDGGSHRVAWAFLRLAGPQGPYVGKLKLQMFEFKSGEIQKLQMFEFKSGHSSTTPFHALTSWQNKQGPGLVDKYPGCLYVNLDVVARPEPEVVITNPQAGIRPILPAGYGSGFETSATPLESLLGGGGPGGAGVGEIGASLAGMGGLLGVAKLPTMEEVSNSKYYRPVNEGCESPLRTPPLPNKGGDLYLSSTNVMTGAEITRLQHVHNDYVYCLVWSRDDRAFVTCSSDGTAKIWELRLYNPMKKTICPTVLRHPSYVYSADFHPNQKAHPIVVTGSYDRLIRLWSRNTGQVVGTEMEGTINSLLFDIVGARIFAADSYGFLQEISVTMAVKSAANPPTSQHPGTGDPMTGAAASQTPILQAEMSLQGPPLQPAVGGAGRGQFAVTEVSATDGAPPQDMSGAAHTLGPTLYPLPDAFQERGSGEQLMALDGEETKYIYPGGYKTDPPEYILRNLRKMDDLEGESISHIVMHLSGRKLGVLTKGSRLVTVDTKELNLVQEFRGMKSKNNPMQPAFSPDGNYLVCGSEDGRCYIWDVEGGPAIHLPAFSLGGDPIYAVAWNKTFHVAAVCSFSSWAPLVVTCYEHHQPPILLPLLGVNKHAADMLKARRKKASLVPRAFGGLPERITPEIVHAMLAELRKDAKGRGIIRVPVELDPNGEDLVVPATPPLRTRPPPEALDSVEHEMALRRQEDRQPAAYFDPYGGMQPPQQQQEQQQGGYVQTVQAVPVSQDPAMDEDPLMPGVKTTPPGTSYSMAGLVPQSEAEERSGRFPAGGRSGATNEDLLPTNEVHKYRPNLSPERVRSMRTRGEEQLLAEADEAAWRMAQKVGITPGMSPTAQQRQTGTDSPYLGAPPEGFTPPEQDRLNTHYGSPSVVAGPGSTVLAGAGSTMVVRPGAKIIDAGALSAQQTRERLERQRAEANPSAGPPYALELDPPLEHPPRTPGGVHSAGGAAQTGGQQQGGSSVAQASQHGLAMETSEMPEVQSAQRGGSSSGEGAGQQLSSS
eukprot:gene26075-11778_t